MVTPNLRSRDLLFQPPWDSTSSPGRFPHIDGLSRRRFPIHKSIILDCGQCLIHKTLELVGQAWYMNWSRLKIALRHARIVQYAVLTL